MLRICVGLLYRLVLGMSLFLLWDAVKYIQSHLLTSYDTLQKMPSFPQQSWAV